MKVYELIALLEATDLNSEILLRTQLSWPFEDTVAGIRIRENIKHQGPVDQDESKQGRQDAPKATNEVVILGGEHRHFWVDDTPDADGLGAAMSKLLRTI